MARHKYDQAFQICRGSDKRLSLISLSVSAGFSHVMLALIENALWKRIEVV